MLEKCLNLILEKVGTLENVGLGLRCVCLDRKGKCQLLYISFDQILILRLQTVL